MSSLSRLADRPTWLLGRANARAQSILATALNGAGVRGYHFRLLAALEQHGPASQAELAQITGIDKSDVVATLDDLANWSLAQRDPDPRDRRRNAVSLTDAGITRLEQLDAALSEVQDAVLEPLDAQERANLLTLLRKLG